LLSAIAKTKKWIEMILKDPSRSFATIAEAENLAERHVRFLAPLAFLSPRIVEAIVEGRAPADLRASGLVRQLPIEWAEQEATLRLSRSNR
jgi:hypothetical protein